MRLNSTLSGPKKSYCGDHDVKLHGVTHMHACSGSGQVEPRRWISARLAVLFTSERPLKPDDYTCFRRKRRNVRVFSGRRQPGVLCRMRHNMYRKYFAESGCCIATREKQVLLTDASLQILNSGTTFGITSFRQEPNPIALVPGCVRHAPRAYMHYLRKAIPCVMPRRTMQLSSIWRMVNHLTSPHRASCLGGYQGASW